jgi:hypothetical protein
MCTAGIVGRATLKMLRRKSKKQFVKQEHNTQNAMVVLNYLMRIAPQQLMLRTQVFTKKLKVQLQLYYCNMILNRRANSQHGKIQTWINRFLSSGLDLYGYVSQSN